MQFSQFKNGDQYLEYLHIFIYHELIYVGKTNIRIEDYKNFEITDVLIVAYNDWVTNNQVNKRTVVQWFEQNTTQVIHFKNNFPKIYTPKVAVWSDRQKTNYYKEKLQQSFLFENYIARLISDNYGLDLNPYLTPQGQYDLGENALGIEIKNDTLIEKYGNVYIEFQEKSKSSNSEYVNSGILKDDNCRYYLIGTEKRFFVFRKVRLLEIFKEEVQNFRNGISSKRGVQFKKIATSRGFVIPVKYIQAETISLETAINEIKQTNNT